METKAEKELKQVMERANIEMTLEEVMEDMTDDEKLIFLHNLRDITYILASKIFSYRMLHNSVVVLHNPDSRLHKI